MKTIQARDFITLKQCQVWLIFPKSPLFPNWFQIQFSPSASRVIIYLGFETCRNATHFWPHSNKTPNGTNSKSLTKATLWGRSLNLPALLLLREFSHVYVVVAGCQTSLPGVFNFFFCWIHRGKNKENTGRTGGCHQKNTWQVKWARADQPKWQLWWFLFNSVDTVKKV